MSTPRKTVVGLTHDHRHQYAEEIVEELIVETRAKLHKWRSLTNQPAQIDTGYVAQHLVSIMTGLLGGGFRGKGDDLENGSEVKAANYLDSFDVRGASSPRWNFSIKQLDDVCNYLDMPMLYVVSIDLAPSEARELNLFEDECVSQTLSKAGVPLARHGRIMRQFDVMQEFSNAHADEQLDRVLDDAVLLGSGLTGIDAARRLLDVAEDVYFATGEERIRLSSDCRVRIWSIQPAKHQHFRNRFELWIEQKAKPKFKLSQTDEKRHDANFQLFPPRFGENDMFAKPGSNRPGELPPVKMPLDSTAGAERSCIWFAMRTVIMTFGDNTPPRFSKHSTLSLRSSELI